MTKILVVEDNEMLRHMICDTLRKEKFDVFEASNGNEGISQARKEKPDIVVTDILMPDKEGIETILELKSEHENIKIIAMSGGGNTKNMTFLDMAQKVGAEFVLSKPFKPSDLMNAVYELNKTV
jgi:DNA-binding response OmpR family regulator